jgi:tripartite-type tricarboxylate transporter receptor subunit TctC
VGVAYAQERWPSRPVRLFVPTPPGGGTDVFARLLGQALAERLGQSFVIENKPGAGGNIGAELVARSAADGYTYLVSASGTMAVNPSLYRDLPFDVERDFAPVAQGATGPFVVLAHRGMPAKTLGELVALGRSEPGKLAFGTAGTGSLTYLGVRMLEERSGARFLHVPYKGMGQAYQDLLAGQVQFIFADLASALPQVRSGKAVALAVTARTPLLPATPTLAESGFPGVEVSNSFSVFAPAAVPRDIVARFGREIGVVLQQPDLVTKLEAQALTPVIDTPERFAEVLRAQTGAWAAFIRRNGITLEN